MQQICSDNSSQGRMAVNNEQKEGRLAMNDEQKENINDKPLWTRYRRVIRKPDRLTYY